VSEGFTQRRKAKEGAKKKFAEGSQSSRRREVPRADVKGGFAASTASSRLFSLRAFA
jgi:hypothetical protein